MKFTKTELALFEYASFSMTEEVDLFYCYHQNIKVFENDLTEDTLKMRIIYIVDTLESMNECQRWVTALQ